MLGAFAPSVIAFNPEFAMRKLISYAVIASFFVVVPLWAHEGHEDAKGDMKGMTLERDPSAAKPVLEPQDS